MVKKQTRFGGSGRDEFYFSPDAKDRTTMTHDDDSPKADDGKTAMQRYASWHARNCRCIPADTAHDGDAAQREDQKKDTLTGSSPGDPVDPGHFSAYDCLVASIPGALRRRSEKGRRFGI